MRAATWLGLTGLSGVTAIALGAFGAHALRPLLPLQMITIFETGVRYHFWHTLALLGCTCAMALFPERVRLLRWAAVFFLAGIVLFSGSLYAMVLSDVPAFGAVTPVGGVSWIVAWSLLATAGFRRQGAGRA